MSKFLNNHFYLPDEHWELFLRVHKEHLKTMDAKNQKKYAIENVLEVMWDGDDIKGLYVCYGDAMWGYKPDGTWVPCGLHAF